MGWKDLSDFIAAVGFPVFVGVWLLVALRPELRKLRQSITTLTVVTAKSNGMSGRDVAEIIKLVTENKPQNRRIEDKVDAKIDSQDPKD